MNLAKHDGYWIKSRIYNSPSMPGTDIKNKMGKELTLEIYDFGCFFIQQKTTIFFSFPGYGENI